MYRILSTIIAIFAVVQLTQTQVRAENYYVDSVKGDDSRAGTSSELAWKSLDKVNRLTLAPGDQVRLAAGGVWQGSLALHGTGSAERPVLIGAYGTGARPRIEGTETDAVRIENFPFVVLEGLEITNRGDGSKPRRGVHLVCADFGTMTGVVVRNLYIHDVNGTNAEKDNGGIILRTRGSRKPSRFDGLLIERNIIWRVDRSGLAADSYHWPRDKWFPSPHVVIKDNFVGDVGGDGIVPWATDGALVEHNIVQGANERAKSYNAGIWPWSADNTLFRLNRASEVKTLLDGQGFDSDYNSRGTRFEYNLSHDNEGGFMLICSPGKRDARENIGNQDTIVRHNISRNDRERIFHVSAVDNAVVEENYVYVGSGLDVQLLLLSDWDGWPNGLLMRNNRYVVEGKIRMGYGKSRNDDGSYGLGEGWGPSKNIRLEGNDEHAKEIAVTDWNGPQFDPTHPEEFPEFLVAHRRWMVALMEAHFGALR